MQQPLCCIVTVWKLIQYTLQHPCHIVQFRRSLPVTLRALTHSPKFRSVTDLVDMCIAQTFTGRFLRMNSLNARLYRSRLLDMPPIDACDTCVATYPARPGLVSIALMTGIVTTVRLVSRQPISTWIGVSEGGLQFQPSHTQFGTRLSTNQIRTHLFRAAAWGGTEESRISWMQITIRRAKRGSCRMNADFDEPKQSQTARRSWPLDIGPGHV